ncbi:MAG: response regulator transcription factor [Alphaproteobacteria bacterium]
MTLLLVEDDLEIADILSRGLKAEGFPVTHVDTVAQGKQLGCSIRFDCIVLDLMLPDGSGHEVCSALRDADMPTPILMLTALDALDDKVHGLRSGADDYLGKPFEFDELLARIEALTRRGRGQLRSPEIYQVADLTLDPKRFRVRRGEREISLTSKEFALLQLLMSGPDKVFSRDAIFDRIWGEKSSGTTNVLEACIARLRRKVDGDGATPLIHTIRGHGYKVGMPAVSQGQ